MRNNFSYTSSTLNFQKKSGIKVCGNYKMPDNLSVEEIYKYYSSILGALDRRKIKRAEVNSRIDFIYSQILRLNPIIGTINGNFQNTEGHVLIAVLSLFNMDDIKSYVEEGKTLRWYLNQPDWDIRYKKQKEIETLTGAPIHWVMCDKTFNRVYTEVCKKYKK
jgi:hypothetical protein